jgi:hypothetical protein
VSDGCKSTFTTRMFSSMIPFGKLDKSVLLDCNMQKSYWWMDEVGEKA